METLVENHMIRSLKVRLILEDKGRMLFLHQTKSQGGKFALVGGRVEDPEFAKAALVRECEEEAGLILDPKDLILVHVLHKHMDNESRINLYFRATKWKGKIESREPKKFKKVKWHYIHQPPAQISTTVKHVLDAFRSGKTYSELDRRKKRIVAEEKVV